MNIPKIFLLSLSLMSSFVLSSASNGKSNYFDATTYQRHENKTIYAKVGEEFSISGLDSGGYSGEENSWKPNYDKTMLSLIDESFVVTGTDGWGEYYDQTQTITFKARKPGKIMLRLFRGAGGVKNFKIIAE